MGIGLDLGYWNAQEADELTRLTEVGMLYLCIMCNNYCKYNRQAIFRFRKSADRPDLR